MRRILISFIGQKTFSQSRIQSRKYKVYIRVVVDKKDFRFIWGKEMVSNFMMENLQFGLTTIMVLKTTHGIQSKKTLMSLVRTTTLMKLKAI